MQSHPSLLKSTPLKSLISHKKKLVEVPYSASISDTINALVADNLVAVPVAAPPGKWIGAGGTMILESDGATGTVRKHYIGIVTMLDILLHIAHDLELGETCTTPDDSNNNNNDNNNLHSRELEACISVSVSSIIGHCMEGLSLWTLSPSTSLLDSMEVFSKGIHRALIPLDTQMEHVIGVELAEASHGYRMLTQMDVLTFINHHKNELQDVLGRSLKELGAINQNAKAVTSRNTVLDTMKAMRIASLNAVPIVEAFHQAPRSVDDHQLIDGIGKKLVGTFSSTDLRGCPIAQLKSWLYLNIVEFTEKMTSTGPRMDFHNSSPIAKKLLVTCTDTSLGEVISMAVKAHVHRVWVVDSGGLLLGLVALTDMLRVIRDSVLAAQL